MNTNLFCVLPLLLIPLNVFAETEAAKPNIIIVMPDDLAYGDYGCLGNPVPKTPAVDAFMKESLLFTNFHVSPTCAPTRAALMSGRHEFKNGVTHTILERERMSLDTFTLPQMLKTARYTTEIFGKWHLGDEKAYRPESRGFDEVYIHGAGGIVVALDFPDGKAVADLQADSNFVVHGLFATEADVEKAKQEIAQARRYGQISCDTYNGRDLPYIDNLVNLVLCKASCKVPVTELMRVIAPGGALMVEGPDGWKTTVKPVAKGTDEWNQFLHSADNNGVSLDDVGPPQRLRWHNTPEYGRSKSLSPSFTNMVSADGVLMTIEDRATTEDVNAPSEYFLVARDAYNGVELWKRPIQEEWIGWQGGSIKSISTQQQRCLAAIGKTVYFCTGFGGPVTALDSRTGAEKQVYEATKQTAEFLIDDNLLYGITGAPFRVGKSNASGSVELYALDLDKGAMIWSKPIANEYTGGTLVVKGRRLVYHSKDGLTCLDRATGEEVWTEAVQADGALLKGRGNLSKEVRRGKKTGPDTPSLFTGNDQPTLVLTDDMVYCAIAAATTAESLSPKWKVDIGSQPTAPVVAGDTVYVADRDSYTLHALDRETGKTRWIYIADGRIDSPPTYYKGMVLFGSRSGWVHCLRASDGQLAWKFAGMPERRLICDSGRLESAWPMNGSIMIYENTAYFAAGRNSFLDGGIGLFALDPATGTMKHGRMVRGPFEADRPNFPIQAAGTFQLRGCKADIFSCASNELFMRNQAFTPDLKPIESESVKTLHLMASPGFLNDSPQHRTYWTVDRDLRYGGATGEFSSGPAGDTIAFDGKLFYEIRGYAPGRNLPARGRGLNQLELYSVYSGSYGGMGEKENPSAIPAMGRWAQRWKTPTPFAGHAIVASDNTVMAAGVPMLKGYSVEDTNASYAGERGGIAWLLDANDGHKLQELRFDAAPVWDGIAIANDHYFISLKDGSVVCLAGKFRER